MPYVDGFLIPVPKRNRDKYRRMSTQAGKLTSFPAGVKLKKGEEVWFSWIVYRSRKDRDRVNGRAMKDPRLAKMMDMKAMPFDSKRMVYGGFRMLVDFTQRDV